MNPEVTYSFVIPVFNEQETVPELTRRLTELMDTLDGPAEVILVDDGSSDGTTEALAGAAARDGRFRVLELSRNFGHQVAITAGLDFARGEATIVMDADLQDPPEVVPRLIERWREGYDLVYAVRERRAGDSRLKRLLARRFYRVLRRLTSVDIPADVGDFRLVDRRALDAFLQMRERNRYVRGMFSWLGFRQIGITYVREERFAGRPKYSFRSSLRLAADGVIGFSNIPLRLALLLGFVMAIASLGVGIFGIVVKLSGMLLVPGWTSILVAVSFIGGVQLMVLGTIGLYLARVHEEVKQRPLYVLRQASRPGSLPSTEASEPDARERSGFTTS